MSLKKLSKCSAADEEWKSSSDTALYGGDSVGVEFCSELLRLGLKLLSATHRVTLAVDALEAAKRACGPQEELDRLERAFRLAREMELQSHETLRDHIAKHRCWAAVYDGASDAW